MPKVIKTCRCGAQYTLESFRARPLVGYMQDTKLTELELRNCTCRSTKAIAIVAVCFTSTCPHVGLPFFPSEDTRFDGKRWNVELPREPAPVDMGRCAA